MRLTVAKIEKSSLRHFSKIPTKCKVRLRFSWETYYMLITFKGVKLCTMYWYTLWRRELYFVHFRSLTFYITLFIHVLSCLIYFPMDGPSTKILITLSIVKILSQFVSVLSVYKVVKLNTLSQNKRVCLKQQIFLSCCHLLVISVRSILQQYNTNKAQDYLLLCMSSEAKTYFA